MESQTPSMQNQQPAIKPTKKCKHLPIIVILAIFAIGGLGFGGLELWQNMQKNDEIKKLQAEKNEEVETSEYQEPQAEQTEEKLEASLGQGGMLQFGGFSVKIPDDIIGFAYLEDTYRIYLWGTVYHQGDQAVGDGIVWGDEKIESPFLAKIYVDHKSDYHEYCSNEKGIFIMNVDENSALCYKETDNLSNYYSSSSMDTYIKPTLEKMRQTFTNADNYIKQ